MRGSGPSLSSGHDMQGSQPLWVVRGGLKLLKMGRGFPVHGYNEGYLAW